MCQNIAFTVVLTVNSFCGIVFQQNREEKYMSDIISKIERLRIDRDAIILAHYYVNEDVQAVADYAGFPLS